MSMTPSETVSPFSFRSGNSEARVQAASTFLALTDSPAQQSGVWSAIFETESYASQLHEKQLPLSVLYVNALPTLASDLVDAMLHPDIPVRLRHPLFNRFSELSSAQQSRLLSATDSATVRMVLDFDLLQHVPRSVLDSYSESYASSVHRLLSSPQVSLVMVENIMAAHSDRLLRKGFLTEPAAAAVSACAALLDRVPAEDVADIIFKFEPSHWWEALVYASVFDQQVLVQFFEAFFNFACQEILASSETPNISGGLHLTASSSDKVFSNMVTMASRVADKAVSLHPKVFAPPPTASHALVEHALKFLRKREKNLVAFQKASNIVLNALRAEVPVTSGRRAAWARVASPQMLFTELAAGSLTPSDVEACGLSDKHVWGLVVFLIAEQPAVVAEPLARDLLILLRNTRTAMQGTPSSAALFTAPNLAPLVLFDEEAFLHEQLSFEDRVELLSFDELLAMSGPGSDSQLADWLRLNASDIGLAELVAWSSSGLTLRQIIAVAHADT